MNNERGTQMFGGIDINLCRKKSQSSDSELMLLDLHSLKMSIGQSYQSEQFFSYLRNNTAIVGTNASSMVPEYVARKAPIKDSQSNHYS